MSKQNFELDSELIDAMYMTIRREEIRNVKTKTYDDKKMVDRIAKHIMKKVEEEMEGKK